MSKDGVELRNITKIFEDKQRRAVVAVDDVSFTVMKGELVTLLGPSGCGKTTMLRMIGGFELPTSGEIYIDGEPVGMLPPNKRNTSMVFQSYALFPHMTIFNNVAYGPRLKKKLSPAEIKTKAHEMMEIVGLKGMEDRHPAQLSGGQQQRVALARALVNEPSVLLFDEPLSNLDARLRVQMREEIRRIQKTLGITSVYVTHDQEEAVCISDRIVVMREGIVEQIGSPEEIYERPTGKFVASFFGKVNFVTVKVNEIKGDSIDTVILGHKFLVRQPGHKIKPGNRVEAVIRPEALEMTSPGEGEIPAVVKNAVYMGSNIEYTVEVAGEKLMLYTPNPKVAGLVPSGSPVGLRLDAGSLHLLNS